MGIWPGYENQVNRDACRPVPHRAFDEQAIAQLVDLLLAGLLG
jgi:hypothetical protein